MRARAVDQYSEFGLCLNQTMDASGLSHAALATALHVSPAQVSLLLTGKRKPAPKWVERIADTMGLSEAQRLDLHRRAARSYGFKL